MKLVQYREMNIPLSSDRLEYLRSIKNGTADQTTIFETIDNDIDKLNEREKTTISNKKQVADLIERLLFHLYSIKKIEYILNEKILGDM